MSTLQIIKLESGTFKHVDSIDGEFFLGRFSFKQELGKAFLVEAYGAKRREYTILDISVFDYLGAEELFTNFTDLINRLTELGYTGIETNGILPTAASYISSDVGNALELGTDSKLFVPASDVDLKLDKVNSSGVERVYIINADGSQSTKPTSDFGGGGTSGLEVLFSAAATYSFTGAATNYVVHSFLIPANTLEVGDFIQMKAFVGRSGTVINNIFPKIYVNTVNSFSGATLVSSGLILDETSTIFQRDYFVRDTKLTSMITNFNQLKSHYNANSTFTETTINRTTDLYFMLVINVTFASETGICNGFIVTKSK